MGFNCGLEVCTLGSQAWDPYLFQGDASLSLTLSCSNRGPRGLYGDSLWPRGVYSWLTSMGSLSVSRGGLSLINSLML